MDFAGNQEMLKVSTALKKIGRYRMREGKYGEIVVSPMLHTGRVNSLPHAATRGKQIVCFGLRSKQSWSKLTIIVRGSPSMGRCL